VKKILFLSFLIFVCFSISLLGCKADERDIRKKIGWTQWVPALIFLSVRKVESLEKMLIGTEGKKSKKRYEKNGWFETSLFLGNY
jgi:hypothetical protein